jgi:predicted nuclease of predicted toxin-antitoxin system
MKFLADVNIPQSTIDYLRAANFDVLDLKRVNLTAKDTEVIEIAQKEKRVIITLDKDFLSLTQFPKYQVATIVIRLKSQKPVDIQEHLDELLKNQKAEIIKNSLTLVKDSIAESHPFDPTS